MNLWDYLDRRHERNSKRPRRTMISNHGSETILLGIIAIGTIALAMRAIHQNDSTEAAAWTAVLMAIIGAVKDRWVQRSADQNNARLHASKPEPRDSVEALDEGETM